MLLFKLPFRQAQPPIIVIGVAVSAGSTAFYSNSQSVFSFAFAGSKAPKNLTRTMRLPTLKNLKTPAFHRLGCGHTETSKLIFLSFGHERMRNT